ncbi:hypothetical protein [Myxococcus qinghaiensis]|uniref:hypothetical protein n=1 Tax=Myxococcus qinghaiensis TaxID=2906758 RepID=UPI0020A7B851|nr:hypothetical protein [Myxococcus qinghaiensis]MCP3165429.1 hypothetical protein [Myxococcus qinghaiensis]
MPNPQLVILFVSLLADGGALPPRGDAVGLDAGVGFVAPGPGRADAGTADARSAIPWPEEELQPVAALDGTAVLAAHSVLTQVLKRFPKEAGRSCAFSPRALEVLVARKDGWHFVRVNRRVDQCPGFGPGVQLETDWFELYAVSPEGRVERYPYHP